jgi:hypothetical protein
MKAGEGLILTYYPLDIQKVSQLFALALQLAGQLLRHLVPQPDEME